MAGILLRRHAESLPLAGPVLRRVSVIPVAWLVIAGLSLAIVRHVMHSPSVAGFNALGYQHFHRWTYRWHGDEKGFAAALALAGDREDYPLLVIDRRGNHYEEALPANEVALKAQFRGERSHFAMSSLALYQEAIDRTNLAETLNADLNAGRPAGPAVLAGFAARQARLLVPQAAEPLLPGASVERRFDGWVLLRP